MIYGAGFTPVLYKIFKVVRSIIWDKAITKTNGIK